jgi:hypothetical protein
MKLLKYQGRIVLAGASGGILPYTFELHCSELPEGFEPPPGAAEGLTLVKVDDGYTWLDLSALGLDAPSCGEGCVPELVVTGNYWPGTDGQAPDDVWLAVPEPPAGVVVSAPEDNALLTLLPLRSLSKTISKYANKPAGYRETHTSDVSDSWSMQGDYHVYEHGTGLFGTPIYVAGEDKYMLVLQWQGHYLAHGDTNATGMPRWCTCRTRDIEQLRQALRQFSVTHGAEHAGYDVYRTDLCVPDDGRLPYLARTYHARSGSIWPRQVYATDVRKIGSIAEAAPIIGRDGSVVLNKMSSNGHRYWGTGATMDDYGVDLGWTYDDVHQPSIVDYYQHSEDYSVGNPPILTETSYDIPYSPPDHVEIALDYRWRKVGYLWNHRSTTVVMWRVNGGLVRIHPWGAPPDGAAYSVDGGATWVPIVNHALVPITYDEMTGAIYAYTHGQPQPSGWTYSKSKGARKVVTVKFLPIDGYTAPDDIDVPVSYYDITEVHLPRGYVALQ